MFFRNCPTELPTVIRRGNELVFGQFQNSEISDSDWYLYLRRSI